MRLSITGIEQRTNARSVEARGGADGPRRLYGYAATFNSPSNPIPAGFDNVGPSMGGVFQEIVAPTFFNRSRGDRFPGVIAAFDHRGDMVLGSTRGGTLRLAVDDVGLDYEVDLTESRYDIWELAARGDLGGSSFKFIATSDTWEYADGMPLRTLISGKLLDVAPVLNPAYSSTSVNVRSVHSSLAKFMDAPIEDVEKHWGNGEVCKFFTNTRMDYPKSRRSPTVHQRAVQLMSMRWGTPLTDKQSRVEAMRIKARWERMADTRKKQLELMAVRWGPKPCSGAQARQETEAMYRHE